jgi:putative transposase
MRTLGRDRVHFCYRRLYVHMLREGWLLGTTQMYRLYTQECLQLSSKVPRRGKMVVTRRERFVPR